MAANYRHNRLVRWMLILLLVFLIGNLLRTFIFATSVVQGDSMHPTIQNGERLLFSKATYLFEDPARGEIVIIKRPLKNYVKRIVALPNETIKVQNNSLYINGEKYYQNFLENGHQTIDFGPVKIPENNYFVMGDNRSRSKDSRNGLGFIEKDEIVGRAELVVFPFSAWRETN